jgi:hypothetical protein
MKTWSVIRGRSWFTLRERKGTSHAHPLKNPVFSIPGGLLKAGVFSLLLHGILVLGLIFGVQPTPGKQVTCIGGRFAAASAGEGNTPKA